MCGIAGIVEFDRRARVERGLLEAMADSIAHRGPDAEGYFVDGAVGLAHRRLSIIDLEGGVQPLFNEDRSAVVVFNGEIYNYEALASKLEARGHRFATRSDTETIVHAWDEKAESCVDELRGMFAFALWDRRLRRLLLARDRLGIKPLYYHLGPDRLVFASEIKALLVHPDVPREVDREALDLLLSLRYIPGPRTLFRDIRKLQPGHLLVWDERGARVRRYWELPRAAAAPTPDAPRRLGEALEESVRMHLMSEVPLGIFLSGGLDSTSVLALGDHVAGGNPFRTYTVGYDDASEEARESNEFAYGRLAAESFDAQHHEARMRDADFRDLLPKIVWHLDEPVADPACVPLYFISRRAREEVTVVLSGEGADEILAGYGIYPRMLALERLHRALGGGILGALAGRFPGERTRRALALAALPLERRYRGVSRAFRPELKRRLLGTADEALVDSLFADRFAPSAGETPLDRMLRVDLTTWLPDDLLIKADRMTMANSQELRVPFLDHVVVELAASLPRSAKLRGATGKAALRDAMANRVPRAILERRKKGFPVPTVSLLQRLGGYSREAILDRDSACRSFFDGTTLERVLGDHERGKKLDQEIWTLLVFELWHRAFLDPARAPARVAPLRAAAAGA